MKPKIIFYDIDGTLLNEHTENIPKSAVQAIIKAKQAGHLSIINTGRTKVILEPYLTTSLFDGFICGCGTYIEYKNKILFHKSLGTNLSKHIAKDMIECRMAGVLEGVNSVYYDFNNTITHQRERVIRMRHLNAGFNCLSYEDENMDFDKFTLFLAENSDYQRFYMKYSASLDFIPRNETTYEVVPKGYSKATGIKQLISLLGIPHDNTYAIGDSTNDLSMLSYAKHSIAMGDSPQQILDIVSYITTTVEDNGISNALKHYRLFE